MKRFWLLLIGAIFGSALCIGAIIAITRPAPMQIHNLSMSILIPAIPIMSGEYEISDRYQAVVCGDIRGAVYATPESHRMIHYLRIGTNVTVYDFWYDKEHVRTWAIIGPAEYVDSKLLCLKGE
jgi:hypothetical protein